MFLFIEIGRLYLIGRLLKTNSVYIKHRLRKFDPASALAVKILYQIRQIIFNMAPFFSYAAELSARLLEPGG